MKKESPGIFAVAETLRFNAYFPPKNGEKRTFYYCLKCRTWSTAKELPNHGIEECEHSIIEFDPNDYDISKSYWGKTKYHDLKCDTEYYFKVVNDVKKFELRKNDRGFKIGDIVFLNETVNGELTGRRSDGFEIEYILYGPIYGLAEGWCIMNFLNPKNG